MLLMCVYPRDVFWIASALQVRLTPAVVKQEVNFLESREISLHRTTVNLKTEATKADLSRQLTQLCLQVLCRTKDWFIFVEFRIRVELEKICNKFDSK